MSPYNPDKHHRRSIRLPDYDYRNDGAYFVTIVTKDRTCLFGDVVNDAMRLNVLGIFVAEEWLRTAIVRPYVELDAFIIMPNHLHGIIILHDVPKRESVGATRRVAPTTETPHKPKGPASGSIGAIIGQFKSAATKRINAHRDTPGAALWQRNYYEHIIRDLDDLNRIRAYIAANPAQWAVDRENPSVG
ncbi:MAG: transposase [Chloroflexi bacterium]|nr:MAG: transposase [Chloroflexota bacterium]